MASEWEDDPIFPHKPPISMNYMNLYDSELPSSSDIWLIPSEAEWPLSCMADQQKSKSPPSSNGMNIRRC